MTDDQGWGDLGVHGNTRIRTPALDALARDAVRLTQFHVSPVCTPTRASLMTGRWHFRTGAIDTYVGRALMRPGEKTLAEMLRTAGYRTGIFGKWHLGDNYPLRAMDRGFEESLVHSGGGLSQNSDPPGSTGYFSTLLKKNGTWVRTEGYCADVFAGAASEFVTRPSSRPFFCYLAFNTPHTPLEVDETEVAPYRAMGLDETTARVYAMTSVTDRAIGRVLDALRKAGLDRNTLVIFLTDNGPQQARYNGSMRGLKGTVYQGGVRVPCFVRLPGRWEGGREVSLPAAHVDLAPTILSVCGAKPAAKMDGSDLSAALDGRIPTPKLQNRPLIFQWHRGNEPEPFRNAAVRAGRWKLVDGKELFDLDTDPGETLDVAARKPEVVRRLRDAYARWFRDVTKPGFEPVRIAIGSDQENPVLLTRQDWRIETENPAPDTTGKWEVEVVREGRATARVFFAPLAGAGVAHLRLGRTAVAQPMAAGATGCLFEGVALAKGTGQAEAWAEVGGKRIGAQLVEFRW